MFGSTAVSCSNPSEHSCELLPVLTDALLTVLRKAFALFYREHITTLVRVFPGIPEVLSVLSERQYQLAVCSSKRRGIGELELQSTGLASFFPITVFLGDVARPKPAPDGILRVMQLAQLHPDNKCNQVAMVGDTEVDVACARSAGVSSVYAAWKWGQEQHMGSLQVQHEVLADFTAQHPSDLLTWFPEYKAC
jgi:phosphoglycolate phosphatase-like HAD superfamily hydrolase